MWGYISTEASYQFNFNVGFATTRSDVLVHLAQWQYWWWFWFALVWTFYYLTVTRIVRYRVLKMKPKIVTSYRPHGKWGDFLACIVPAVWCLNILTNSNFILRLIEWQNESSLFTVRVRAKQWYWIYKFELKNFTDILTAPKNIGRNKWQVNTFGDLQVADDYLHILQLRSQNKWIKSYWEKILKSSTKINKHHIISPQEQLRLEFKNVLDSLEVQNTNYNLNLRNYLNLNYKLDKNLYSLNYSYLANLKVKLLSWEESDISEKLFLFNESQLNNSTLNDSIITKSYKMLNYNIINYFKNLNNLNYRNKLIYSDPIELTRFEKRSLGITTPIRLIKKPLVSVDNNILVNGDDLFRIRFNDNLNKTQHKIINTMPYLTLKQKRANRITTITPVKKYETNFDGSKSQLVRYSGNPLLINNNIFEDSIFDPTQYHRMVKKNKKRADLIPVTLAKRIIRTNAILILPAHINITLITNSYDIVHAWFIPGLGIKLDCVPGRSTHHTFYIDNVGFYYGQCAEICGRYHHHMPIRLCALPFEHFLVWWHSYGLPKLLFTPKANRYQNYYAFRKYVW